MSGSDQAMSRRLKLQLRLAVNRLRMVQQKQTALAKVSRREIASLLESRKEASARIRVENIIREDISVELLEILELYCELLLARFGLLERIKECDPGLEEAVKTLIYAAPRSEIKELILVRDLLVMRFGKDFCRIASENEDEKVNEKVLDKLRVESISEDLVTNYLLEIARTYNVDWGECARREADQNGDRACETNANETSSAQLLSSHSEAAVSSAMPAVAKSDVQSSTKSPVNLEISCDELMKRFEALKKM